MLLSRHALDVDRRPRPVQHCREQEFLRGPRRLMDWRRRPSRRGLVRTPAAPFVAAACLGMRIVDFLCVEKPSRKSVLRVTVKSTEFLLAALCAKRTDLTNDL